MTEDPGFLAWLVSKWPDLVRVLAVVAGSFAAMFIVVHLDKRR